MIPGATAFLCFCLVAVYSVDGGETARKTKRDVSGLVSFPRIGRSDHSARKTVPPEMKRQSLVSFPRTGRRDLSVDVVDYLMPAFGPGSRSGQTEKKEATNGKIWALISVKDLPMLLANTPVKDIKTFGDESSEEIG